MKKLIYENPLQSKEDVVSFILEGQAETSFENGRMRLSSVMSPELGQEANYVYWCDVTFPTNIEIEWEFTPLNERGLCILFFSAAGRGGEDLFDSSLAERTGPYGNYHSGDINAYHISYFRRSYPEERAFRTCNLRKSYGFELLTLSGDPLPNVVDSDEFYSMKVRKYDGEISFYINDLLIFQYHDTEEVWKEGKIGFRQMSPMVAEYANFRVYEL